MDVVLTAHRLTVLSIAVSLAPLGMGCVFFRSAETPMEVQWDEPAPPKRSRGLAVMLPGIFDAPDDFRQEGVIADLRALDPTWNVALPDAHLGYYKGKHNTIVERLAADVIRPACARGYQEIWLVGVSLGGFGSMLYASRHPSEITGLIILAPFPGPDEIHEEIAQAGGLPMWSPGNSAGLDGETRFFRNVWTWVDGYVDGAAHRPPLFLGYGGSDDFAPANRLIADVLPPSRVSVDPDGGHDWEVWAGAFRTLAGRALQKPAADPVRCWGEKRRIPAVP